MATRTEITDVGSLVELINEAHASFGPIVAAGDLECEFYSHDERIPEETYIVCYKTGGVVGMASGPIPGLPDDPEVRRKKEIASGVRNSLEELNEYLTALKNGEKWP